MEGWIKLHRKLLEWEWYSDGNVFRFFIHCLLRANHEDKKYRGVLIKRGEFTSSYDVLSNETGLTIKQIRTCLSKLKRTNEMASKSTNQFTLFQIVNYDSYQEGASQRAGEGQTEDKRRATNKNYKNEKNNKKENYIKEKKDNPLHNAFMKFIEQKHFQSLNHMELMSQSQLEELCSEFGQTNLKDILESMANWKDIKKRKNMYLTAKKWLNNDKVKNPSRYIKKESVQVGPIENPYQG